MSRMSELHDDLAQIHVILLGQRKVAADRMKSFGYGTFADINTVEVIDDLLLEFEAAGVVWPDNIVELHHD